MAAYTEKAYAGWKNDVKKQLNHMERVMGARLSTWHVRNWNARAREVKARYFHPPHYYQWLCIHHYEGAWNSTSNPIYDGGLQMDISFQGHYGRYLLRKKGTADRWTPLEQMWTAEKAYYDGRGFSPWPNTARYCHLIR